MRKDLGKKLEFIPLPVLIIGTYDENKNPNAMNAAWGTVRDYDKICITLSNHKTTDNFLKTKAFTVSFATKETKDISDYFGIATGNKENKIEKSKVKITESKYVNAPIIEEYPLTLECEVESYEDELLVGKIINTSVDEKYLTEDGNIKIDEMNLLLFDMTSNTYRVLGDVVGKAFSDGKNIK